MVTRGWVCPVHSNDVRKVWPLALPYIERFLEFFDGKYEPADIIAMAEDQTAHLWLYGAPIDVTTGYPKDVRAALVTRFLHFPRSKRMLLFGFAARNGAETLPILNDLERIAKERGCDAVEMYGRRGWQRALIGYEPVAVYLRKRL